MSTAPDIAPALPEGVRLLVGNCLETLRALPAESVHCCVTSPPYYALRDYGTQPVAWPSVTYSPMPGLPPITVPATVCALGLEPTIEAYVGHLVLVFRTVHDVLRDDGTLWLNLGDSSAQGRVGRDDGGRRAEYKVRSGQRPNAGTHRRETPTVHRVSRGLAAKQLMGVPWRVAFALQADGWILRSDQVWAKKNPLPESVRDRPTRAHEFVFLFAKQRRYYYDRLAIAEPLEHPEASTPEDLARAFGRRRAARPVVTQGPATIGGAVPPTRNKRSVWFLSTQPFKGGHFAAFPATLAEIPIRAGTSEHGCCAACGAQWTRIAGSRKRAPGRGNGNKVRRYAAHGQQDRLNTHQGYAFPWQPHVVPTVGWAPTCACGALAVPCTVLDCFGGSGTSGAVARVLGRHAVLCESQPAYVPLIHQRIAAALTRKPARNPRGSIVARGEQRSLFGGDHG